MTYDAIKPRAYAADLLRTAAVDYGISTEMLLNSRSEPACFARQLACYLCREVGGLSVYETSIAIRCNFRTVRRRVLAAKNRQRDPDFAAHLGALVCDLRARFALPAAA